MYRGSVEECEKRGAKEQKQQKQQKVHKCKNYFYVYNIMKANN